MDNSTLHICGLYPFEGWGNPANDECKFTFNGSQDVMAAPEKSSTKNDSKDGNYPQLEFKHLLTQLVIKAVAEDEAAIAKWGKLTDITLTKVGKNNPSGAVTVSLSAGTADESSAFATLLDNGMSFWVRGAGTETAFASQAKELTTDGEEVAYSMVAPLKNATGTADYTLAVKQNIGYYACHCACQSENNRQQCRLYGIYTGQEVRGAPYIQSYRNKGNGHGERLGRRWRQQ